MAHYSIVLVTFIFFSFSCNIVRPLSSAELLMIESASCEWCEAWDEEIGSVYSKTEEGLFAPLRRIDIADIVSEKDAKIRLPSFTPTFVVLDQGNEVARIIGYPGEDFFWPMLVDALKKIGFKSEN